MTQNHTAMAFLINCISGGDLDFDTAITLAVSQYNLHALDQELLELNYKHQHMAQGK
jgi:hypothetical protein